MALNEEIGKTKEYIKIGSDFKAGSTFSRNESGAIIPETGADQTTVNNKKGNLLCAGELLLQYDADHGGDLDGGIINDQKLGYLITNHVTITDLGTLKDAYGYIISNEGPSKPSYAMPNLVEGDKINSFSILRSYTTSSWRGMQIYYYTWRTTGTYYHSDIVGSQASSSAGLSRTWLAWTCKSPNDYSSYKSENWIYSKCVTNAAPTTVNLSPVFYDYSKRTKKEHGPYPDSNHVYKFQTFFPDSNWSLNNTRLNFRSCLGKITDTRNNGETAANIDSIALWVSIIFPITTLDKNTLYISYYNSTSGQKQEYGVKTLSIGYESFNGITSDNKYIYNSQLNNRYDTHSINYTGVFSWTASLQSHGYCEYDSNYIYFNIYNGTAKTKTIKIPRSFNTDFFNDISSGHSISAASCQSVNNQILIYVLINNADWLTSTSAKLYRISLNLN